MELLTNEQELSISKFIGMAFSIQTLNLCLLEIIVFRCIILMKVKYLLEKITIFFLLILVIYGGYVKTFTNKIETRSLVCRNDSDFGSTFSITFSTQRNHTNYGKALSFQRIDQIIQYKNYTTPVEYCFSLFVKILYHDQTTLQYKVGSSSCDPYLVCLRVRYLIVDSDLLSDIQFIYEFSNFSSFTYTTDPLIYSQSVSVDSSNVIVSLMLNGFSAAKYHNQNIRIDLNYVLTNTRLKVYLQNVPYYQYVHFVSYTIIIIKKPFTINNFNGNFSHYSVNCAYQQPYIFYIVDSQTVFDSSTTFFGIRSFMSGYTHKIDFRFYIDSSNTIAYQVFDNPNSPHSSSFQVEIINFALQICPSYYQDFNQTCVFSCNSSSYGNSVDKPYLCQLCSSVCLTCTKYQDNCVTCNDTSYKTSSSYPNNTCRLCEYPLLSCSSQTQCITCVYLYKCYNSQCSPNCTIKHDQCIQCNLIDSNTTLNCTDCGTNTGYLAIAGQCQTVCGDGLLRGSEQCDDGNNVDQDGCSQLCTIQYYYNCFNLTPNSSSNCTLKELTISYSYAIKDKHQNQFTAYCFIAPPLTVFSKLDWTNSLSAVPNIITFQSVTFDRALKALVAKGTYNATLQNQEVKFKVNYTAVKPQFFQQRQLTHKITAQNNLSLEYYQSTAYAFASLIQYFCLIISALSILMFLLGFISGKVIALQHAAVLQLAYLCAITVADASPTFAALRSLQLSTGIIHFGEYDYSSSFDKHLKGVSFDPNPLSSCFVDFAIILLPLTIGLVLKLLSVTCCKDKKIIVKLYPQFLGQTVFYGIVFSSYAIFTELFLGLCSFEAIDSWGIGISGAFSLLALSYVWFLVRFPLNFGDFKRRFQKMNANEYFYCYVVIQRLLSSITVVLLRGIPWGLAIIVLLMSGLLFFVGLRKPYVEGGSKRALLNYAILTLIVLLFLINNLNVSNQFVPIYSPLIISLLLGIAQCYNMYFLYQQFKEIKTQGEELGISFFDVCLSKVKKYEQLESIEQKNEFQLQRFTRNVIGDAPILSAKFQGVKINEKINSQWKNYATLSELKVSLLNKVRYNKDDENIESNEGGI